jgi:hypothetical protein
MDIAHHKKKKKKLEVIIQIQPKILDNNIRRSHMDRCSNISENQTKSNKKNEKSIHLYSINQFYLI